MVSGAQEARFMAQEYVRKHKNELIAVIYSLLWSVAKGKPARMIEEPTQLQAQILKAFGHAVRRSGVLQKID
jgi:hypothetical protein